MSINFCPMDHDTDIEERLKLFTLSFPESIEAETNTLDHYNWKFHTPGRQSYEYLARGDDKILGYYAAISYPYIVQGVKKNVAMVCDVMTHPDARGQGVFTKIGRYATAELAKESLAFSTGYPIRPEVIPGHLKVGWQECFKLPVYIAPLKSNAILSSLGLAPLALLANPILSIANKLVGLCFGGDSEGYKVRVISNHELLDWGSYDDFFQEWSSGRDNYLVKDREFLAWRLGAPGAEYKIVCLESNGSLAAVVITREELLNGVPSLAILDFMTLPTAKQGLGFLVEQLKVLANKNGLEALAMMAPEEFSREQSLLKYGFFRSHLSFTVISKQLDGASIVGASASADWPMMWIDSDDL